MSAHSRRLRSGQTPGVPGAGKQTGEEGATAASWDGDCTDGVGLSEAMVALVS